MEHPVMDRMETDSTSGSVQTVEQAALAGAAAIQRIIAERDKLRDLTESQKSEMARLRSENDESRRRVLKIRQHYLELATEVLSRFEKFDEALRRAMNQTNGQLSPRAAVSSTPQDLRSQRTDAH
jgi:predicted  nucleic acid-binding Zn-ribbon protein